ncbi:hypothetical protein BGW39_003472 [Mortierella sp. 14UC]|nr:hypothetical protein BGW39_003472 [Mortierella sp. 14UC]
MATTQPPKPPVTTANPPKPTVVPPKPTSQPPVVVPPKPTTPVIVPPKPPTPVVPTNPIITVNPTTPVKPTTTYGGGPILTVQSSTTTTSVGLSGNSRGNGGSTSNSDGGGMSAAAIGGLVAGLAIVLVGSVVGGFLLLKQRRKRMMFVGLGASAGSSSRYGGDGYPDPPALPRPPRAGFHREDRPGSGTWSARSGYSGGGSSIGRRPFVNNHSDMFDEKGYHAETAGLGGARMSVMGGVGSGAGGYNSNLSGESFTQLHDGRFVANGRRGEGSQGGYVAGDVDHYPYDAQEYDARMYNKEISSSSAAFLPSPPSSPEGAYPPESISPIESTGSTARLDGAINGGPQPSPLLGAGPGPNPRASGYYDYNHQPLRTPSRTNMHGGAPPLSPNGNFVNRSMSRMSSASVPYAPDGLPLFPPRPVSQYQHANYHPNPGQQQYYPAPRSPPPHMGGGPGPNNYYSPRLGPQYQQQQPHHPYQPQPQQQQQPRFLQNPHHQQMYSGPISPMTSSSVTAYDENEHGTHSPQKYVSNESFEKHQMYEETYVHPPPQQQSEVTGAAPQALVENNNNNDKSSNDVSTPAPADSGEPTDLATLTPVVPNNTVSAPPLPLSTKPSIGQLSVS